MKVIDIISLMDADSTVILLNGNSEEIAIANAKDSIPEEYNDAEVLFLHTVDFALEIMIDAD